MRGPDFFYNSLLGTYAIVGSFFCNVNIVRMRFLETCTGDTYKLTVFLESGNVCSRSNNLNVVVAHYHKNGFVKLERVKESNHFFGLAVFNSDASHFFDGLAGPQ